MFRFYKSAHAGSRSFTKYQKLSEAEWDMPKPHRLTFWQETWPNGVAQGNAGSVEF
jgi:hypothetical protein